MICNVYHEKGKARQRDIFLLFFLTSDGWDSRASIMGRRRVRNIIVLDPLLSFIPVDASTINALSDDTN
jgi:hypothetical protein